MFFVFISRYLKNITYVHKHNSLCSNFNQGIIQTFGLGQELHVQYIYIYIYIYI